MESEMRMRMGNRMGNENGKSFFFRMADVKVGVGVVHI